MSAAQSIKKVLLVDDEPDFRQLVKELILEHFEANIFEASDGIEAVNKLRNDEFCLVITDLRMPKLTGTELVKSIQTNQNMYHIKMKTPQPNMIIMSGSIDSGVVESINEKGKLKAFHKPINTQEFVQELKTHLHLKK